MKRSIEGLNPIPRVCKCGAGFSSTNYMIKKSDRDADYRYTVYLNCFECKNKYHTCVCCPALFKTPKDMYNHFSRCHQKERACNICNIQEANLYPHYIEHYKEIYKRTDLPSKRRKSEKPVFIYNEESLLITDNEQEINTNLELLADIENFDPDDYLENEPSVSDVVRFDISGEETLHPPVEVHHDLQELIGSDSIYLDIPLLDISPPPRTMTYIDLGFKSYNAFHFAVNHLMLSSLTVRQADELLHSMKNVYFKECSEKYTLPNNASELMRCLKRLPFQQPINNRYSIKTTLSRIFNCVEHTKHMWLQHKSQTTVSEYSQTEHFRLLTTKCEDDVYPISITLYYDKFRNYRVCPGSSGGLYFSILNFDRKHRSKPRNIFLCSLIKEGIQYESIMKDVLDEIRDLGQVHQVYHAGLKKYIKIRVFLGVYVADMPERHIACSMMSHSGNSSKCIHCHADCNSLTDNPTTNPKANWTTKRTEDITKSEFTTVLENFKVAKTKTQLHSDCSYFGISTNQFTLADQTFRDNIFWNIPYFDVHSNTPPDLFHSVVLGIIRSHLDIIMEKLNATEQDTLENLVNTFKFQNTLLPNFKNRAYWNGDQWLRFWVASPLIMQQFFCQRGEVAATSRISSSALLTSWFQQINWVKIILKSSLSQEEVDEAERICLVWREMMVSVFGSDRMSFPNFHCILHLFDSARMFGPPVLYWARPYEHKHKTFRRYISQSNKRNSEGWSSQKEMMLQCIEYLFPEFSVRPRKVSAQLCNGMDVAILMNYSICYGSIVKELQGSKYLVQTYLFSRRHSELKFPYYTSKTNGPVIEVAQDGIVGKVYITSGYVNELYNLLNFSSLKHRE